MKFNRKLLLLGSLFSIVYSASVFSSTPQEIWDTSITQLTQQLPPRI